MLAARMPARSGSPSLEAITPLAVRAALLVAIGVELAVLVAFVPDRATRYWAGGPGDFWTLYVRARHLRLMGLYSPVLTPILYPISRAGLHAGFRIFFCLNVAALLTVAYIAQRPLRTLEARVATALAVVSLPQAQWALRFGHTTPLLALAMLCGFMLVQRHPVRGAAVLALLSIKPQYAVAPLIYLAARRRFLLFGVLAGVALALAAVGFAVVGPWEAVAYVRDGVNWGSNTTSNLLPVQQAWMYSWPGFLISIGDEPNRLLTADLLLLSAGVTLVACARLDGMRAASVAALSMILVTPYSQFYDACLLTAAFALLIRAQLRPAVTGVLVGGLYLAAVASQANTIYPAPDVLGDAATNGIFWITPALLLAIAALAVLAPARPREEEAA
jgi:hypothetical protein